MNLTQNKLDDIYESLKTEGGGFAKVDRNAPRFDQRKRKLSIKEAQAIRAEEIQQALRDVVELMNRPLQTHEYYYAKLRKGSKAWKKRGAEVMFPLIISREATNALMVAKNK